MCRPSCCKPPDEGTGIAAVAVIAAVFVAVKIGPAAASIWHIAVEALTISTLTCAAAAMCILVTWAAARIIGTRRARRQALPVPVRQPIGQAHSAPRCLACGDTGIVVRTIGPNQDQVSDCPVCQPDSWTG
jgi:hypothetical protein